MTGSIRAAAAITIALAAFLPAQHPGAATLGALRTPIHTQPADEGYAYGIWAAGERYKASFHDGMTFVPYVGPRTAAPALSWRTTSARVGDVELVTAAKPAPSWSEWRAEYDLGGVVEAYEVRLDGLEQTFVIAQKPNSHGDLVIRGTVATALQPRPASGHGAIGWCDEGGRALVQYGAAVAIDADGRRCPMTTTVGADGVELRLPATWLGEAAFPLVVDPLLTATTVDSGAEVTDIAIVHDPVGPYEVWVAEVRVTGTDHDLRIFRTNESGWSQTLVFTDLSANWSSIEPSLGVNRPVAETLLAFTRHFLNDTCRVRLHAHSRYDVATSSTVFNVPSNAGVNHWRPAVGSEVSLVSWSQLLVAYQAESTGTFSNTTGSDIEAVNVSLNAGGSVVDQFPVAAAVATDNERPTVAKVMAGATGPTQLWTIGYQRSNNILGGTHWDVALRRVDGIAVGAEFVVDGATDRHEFAPKLAGADDRLMLFYAASTLVQAPFRPAGVAGYALRGTRVDWNGATFVTPHGSAQLLAYADPRLELGGADFDIDSGSHWVMAYRSNVSQAVYVRRYGYSGSLLSADLVESPSVAAGTSVGGAVAFQTNADEFLIAYGMTNPPANSLSRMRRLTYPTVSLPSTSGTACTSTELSWFGAQWIGTEHCGVELVNAPANSFSVVLVATSSASVQLFGIGGVHDGCWLLVPPNGPDYLGMPGPILGTTGSWQLPLPEALADMSLRFQAVTFDGATAEFYSSNRLTVPLVK